MLADQSGRTSYSLALKAGKKELAKEGVEGLLDAVLLITAREEPFQYQQGTTLWVGLRGRRNKNGRVLGPVGWELDGRFGGEDEGWSGDVGQVAADGCD